MSERKGAASRGSLMDLAKPRLAHTPIATPLDEAERRILSAAAAVPSPPAAPPPVAAPSAALEHPAGTTPPPPVGLPPEPIAAPVPPAVQTPADAAPPSGPSPLPAGAGPDDELLARLRKTRQPIAVVGFKLPARLKEELAAVAQYNGTDMTRIVVAALERFLAGLPHPPGWRN